VAGEAGVSWVLELLRREIDRTMALGGWAQLSDIDQSVVFARHHELRSNSRNTSV
jgi:isopentenyl diphosphate isomerase/L-lactate dehydrogenase-like FMN-dependent dehydrogenase